MRQVSGRETIIMGQFKWIVFPAFILACPIATADDVIITGATSTSQQFVKEEVIEKEVVLAKADFKEYLDHPYKVGTRIRFKSEAEGLKISQLRGNSFFSVLDMRLKDFIFKKGNPDFFPLKYDKLPELMASKMDRGQPYELFVRRKGQKLKIMFKWRSEDMPKSDY